MLHTSAGELAHTTTARADDHHPAGGTCAAVISRSAAMAVRRALNALRDGWLLEDRIHRAARMIAEDAHRHGLRAEEMLVALKREWEEWTAFSIVPDAESVREFARRLVTVCIHEFYAPHHAARPCAAGACRAD